MSKLNLKSQLMRSFNLKQSSVYQKDQQKMKLEKDLMIMKLINKTKTKGVLAIGEHENKNAVIDTDSSDVAIGKKAQKVTKLVCYSSIQKVISTKPSSQTREKLSSYLVKPQAKQTTTNHEEEQMKKMKKREFTIIIPGQEHNLQKASNTKSERRFDRYSTENMLLFSPSQSSINTNFNKISHNKFKSTSNELYSGDKREKEKEEFRPHHQYNISSPFSVSGYEIFNTQPDTKTSHVNLQKKLEQYSEKRRDTDDRVAFSAYSRESKAQSRISIGGNVNLLRLSEFYEYIRKYQMRKVFLIQQTWRLYFNRSMKVKYITMIQSFWRRYWLRTTLYYGIQRYYKGRAFIQHIKNYALLFKKSYWWKFSKKLRIMPKYNGSITQRSNNILMKPIVVNTNELFKTSKNPTIQTFNSEPKYDAQFMNFTSRSILKNSINDTVILSPILQKGETKMDNRLNEILTIDQKCVDIEYTPLKKKDGVLRSKKQKSLLLIEKSEVCINTIPGINSKEKRFEKLYNELLIEVDKMKEMVNNTKQFEFFNIETGNQFELVYNQKYDMPLKPKVKQKSIFADSKIKEDREIAFTYDKIQHELMISLSKNNNMVIPQWHCPMFKGQKVEFYKNNRLSLKSSYDKIIPQREKKVYSSFTEMETKKELLFNLIAKKKENTKAYSSFKDIKTTNEVLLNLIAQQKEKEIKVYSSFTDINTINEVLFNLIAKKKEKEKIEYSSFKEMETKNEALFNLLADQKEKKIISSFGKIQTKNEVLVNLIAKEKEIEKIVYSSFKEILTKREIMLNLIAKEKEKIKLSSFTKIRINNEALFNLISQEEKKEKVASSFTQIKTTNEVSVNLLTPQKIKEKKVYSSFTKIQTKNEVLFNLLSSQKEKKVYFSFAKMQIEKEALFDLLVKEKQQEKVKIAYSSFTEIKKKSEALFELISKKKEKMIIPFAQSSFEINIQSSLKEKHIIPHKEISFNITNSVMLNKSIEMQVLKSKENSYNQLKTERYSFSLWTKDLTEDKEQPIKMEIIKLKEDNNASSFTIEQNSFNIIRNAPLIEITKKEVPFTIEVISFNITKQQSEIERRIKRKQMLERKRRESSKLLIQQNSFDISTNDQLTISKQKKEILKTEPDSFSILKMKSMTETKRKLKIDLISFDIIKASPIEKKKKPEEVLEIELISFDIITKQEDKSKEDRIKQVQIRKENRDEYTMELISFDILKTQKEKNKEVKLEKKGTKLKHKPEDILQIEFSSFNILLHKTAILHEKQRNEILAIESFSFDILLNQITKVFKTKKDESLIIESASFNILLDQRPLVNMNQKHKDEILIVESNSFDILTEEKESHGPAMIQIRKVLIQKTEKILIKEEESLPADNSNSIGDATEEYRLKSKAKTLTKSKPEEIKVQKEDKKIELLISNQVNNLTVMNIEKNKIYETDKCNSISLFPLYKPKQAFNALSSIQNEFIEICKNSKVIKQTPIKSIENNTVTENSFSLQNIIRPRRFNIQSLQIEQVITQPKPQEITSKKSSKWKTKKPEKYQPMNSITKDKDTDKEKEIPQLGKSIYSISIPLKIQIQSNNKMFDREKIILQSNNQFTLQNKKEDSQKKTIEPKYDLLIEQNAFECLETNKSIITLPDKTIITTIQKEVDIKRNQFDYISQNVNSFDILQIQSETKEEEDTKKTTNTMSTYKTKRQKSKHNLTKQTSKHTKQQITTDNLDNTANINTTNNSNVHDKYTINQFAIELYPSNSSLTNSKKDTSGIEYISTSVESFICQPPQQQETMFSKVLNVTKKVQASLELPLKPFNSFKFNSPLETTKHFIDNANTSVLVNKFRKKYILSSNDDDLIQNPTEKNAENQQKETTTSSISNWNNNTSPIMNCSFQVLPKHSIRISDKDEGEKEQSYANNDDNNMNKSKQDEENRNNKEQQLSAGLNESVFTRYFKQRPGSNEHFRIKFLQTYSFEFTLKALYEYEELVQKILANDRWNKISLLDLIPQEQFEILSKYHNAIIDNSSNLDPDYSKTFSLKNIFTKSIFLLKLKHFIGSNSRKYAYVKLIEEMRKKKNNDQKKVIFSIVKEKDDQILKNALRKWNISQVICRVNDKIKENNKKAVELYSYENSSLISISGKEKKDSIIEKQDDIHYIGIKNPVLEILEKKKENELKYEHQSPTIKKNSIEFNELSFAILNHIHKSNRDTQTINDNNKWNSDNTITKLDNVEIIPLRKSINSEQFSVRASERMSFARQFSFGVRNSNNIISTLNTEIIIEEEASPKSLRTGKRIVKPSTFKKETESNENDIIEIKNETKDIKNYDKFKAIIYKTHNQNNLSVCKSFMKWQYNSIRKSFINVTMTKYQSISHLDTISTDTYINHMKRGISLTKLHHIAQINQLKTYYNQWKRTNVRTEKRRYTLRISRSNPKNEDINNQMKRIIRMKLARTNNSVFAKRILYKCILTINQNTNDAFLLHYIRKWAGIHIRPKKMSLMRQYTVKTRIRGIFILKKKFKYWRKICLTMPNPISKPQMTKEEEGNYIIYIDSDEENKNNTQVLFTKANPSSDNKELESQEKELLQQIPESKPLLSIDNIDNHSESLKVNKQYEEIKKKILSDLYNQKMQLITQIHNEQIEMLPKYEINLSHYLRNIEVYPGEVFEIDNTLANEEKNNLSQSLISLKEQKTIIFEQQNSFGLNLNNESNKQTSEIKYIIYYEDNTNPKPLKGKTKLINKTDNQMQEVIEKEYKSYSDSQTNRFNSLKQIIHIPKTQRKIKVLKSFMKWQYNSIRKSFINVTMTKYQSISNFDTISDDTYINHMKRGISLTKLHHIAQINLLKTYYNQWKRTNVRTEKRRNTLRISRSNPKNEDINNQMKRIIRMKLAQTKSSIFAQNILLNCITTINKNNNDAFMLYYMGKWAGKHMRPKQISIIRKYIVKTKITGRFILKKKFKYWHSICNIISKPQMTKEEEGNYIILIDSENDIKQNKLMRIIQNKERKICNVYLNKWKQNKSIMCNNQSFTSLEDKQDQQTPRCTQIRFKKVKKPKEKNANQDDSFSSSHKKKQMNIYKRYIPTSISGIRANILDIEEDGADFQLRKGMRLQTVGKPYMHLSSELFTESQAIKQVSFTQVIQSNLLKQAFSIFVQNTIGKGESQKQIKTYTIVIKKIKRTRRYNNKLRLCFNRWKQNLLLNYQSCQRNKLSKALKVIAKSNLSMRYYFHKWSKTKIKKSLKLMIHYYNKKLRHENSSDFKEKMMKLLLVKFNQWKIVYETLRVMKPVIYYSSSPNNKIVRLPLVSQELNSDTNTLRSKDSQSMGKNMLTIKTKNTKVKEIITKRILNDDFYVKRYYFNYWRFKQENYKMNIKDKKENMIANEDMSLSPISPSSPRMIKVKIRKVYYAKVNKFATSYKKIITFTFTKRQLRQSFNHWRTVNKMNQNNYDDNRSVNISICSSSNRSKSKHQFMNYVYNLNKEKGLQSYTHSSSSNRKLYCQYNLLRLFNKTIGVKFNSLHKELYRYSKTKMVVTLIDYAIKHHIMKWIYKLTLLESSDDISLLQSYNIFSNLGRTQSINIKTIAANFIQYHYRQHRNKIVNLFYINALSKIFQAFQLKDKRLSSSLISFKQWKAKIKIMNSKARKSEYQLINMINKSIIKKKCTYLHEFINSYVEDMKVNHLAELIKTIGCGKLFNIMKRNRILYKYMVKSIKSFNYSKMFLKWRRICKMKKRKENSLLKIIKVIKRNIRMDTLRKVKGLN